MPTMVRSRRKLRIGSKCARPGVQRVYSRGPEQGADVGVNPANPPSKMKLTSLQRAQHMAIHFNHTILPARDSKASADFLAEMLGLPAPRRWGRSTWSRPTTTPISTIWIPRRRSCASITPFWSTTPNSNKYSTASAHGTVVRSVSYAVDRMRHEIAARCSNGKIYGFHEDVSDGDDRKHCMGVCRRMKQGGHFPGIMRTEVPCTRGP